MNERSKATEHPRPLLRRPWRCLDGTWEAQLDRERALDRPDQVGFAERIVVPFAPETPASGMSAAGRVERAWYRRAVDVEAARPGERLVVHFGAVDRDARVWANGVPVAEHEGGYTGFSADVTEVVADAGLELVVRADDEAGDLDAPRGKQDWQDDPHFIWYPRTTGIWRTVWLERAPAVAIDQLRWRPNTATMTLELDAQLRGPVPAGARLAVRVRAGDRRVVDDTCSLSGDNRVQRTFAVGDGGIDDAASLLWWPRNPVVLDAQVALVTADGTVLDEVDSYTAMRSVDVADGHLRLNGRPYPLRLVLDQGYWPATGATPPDGNALRADIELTKALGFNGARKHQKTEDPRYLAWADRLGLLVWVEMPSAYRASPRSAARLLREWPQVVETYAGHPSVIAWVPCNESWGVPDLPGDRRQRALLDALAAQTDALDGTRPVSVNDGWETAGGSIVGVHDYTQDPGTLRSRYADRAAIDALLTGTRWDGRAAELDHRGADGRAVVLSEFGGVGLADPAHTKAWGYVRADSAEDLLARYREQWAAVHASTGLAGACWTQLTDTYQEVNGLVTFDRQPKAPIDDLAAATRGR